VTLTLASIALREIRLRLKEPFRISSGVVEERRIALLELIDADGLRVWSECVAGEQPNYSPETIDTAWLAIREWIAPRVLGRTFGSPGNVHACLSADIRGHEMARASVEMGCWALVAQREGVSLARSIGGTRSAVPTASRSASRWRLKRWHTGRPKRRTRGIGR
jgi:O-succinylbenzoate synthase